MAATRTYVHEIIIPHNILWQPKMGLVDVFFQIQSSFLKDLTNTAGVLEDNIQGTLHGSEIRVYQ